MGAPLSGVATERHDGVDPGGSVGRGPDEEPGRRRAEHDDQGDAEHQDPATRGQGHESLGTDDDLAGVRISLETGEALGKVLETDRLGDHGNGVEDDDGRERRACR